MLKKTIFFILICLSAGGLFYNIYYFHSSSPVYMSNDKLEVGILPDSGGRVVLFKLKNGKNVLKSVPELWERRFPKPRLEYPDIELLGHIVWVAPQEDWWTQQDLLPEKKAERSDWPPDPFTIYARYEIIEHSSTNLLMTAPPSPVTGLKMTKQFILDDDSLTMITTAENMRTEPVAWNLWSNTRLEPENQVYIPISSTNDIKRFSPGWKSAGIYVPYVITNNYFLYDTDLKPIDDTMKKWSTKVFIDPSKQLFKTILDDSIFIKELPENVDISDVHSNHAPIELYIEFDPGKGSLMEQEFHGEYSTIDPGQSIHMIEKWDLIPRTF